MKNKKRDKEEIDLNKDVGEGDPRMIKAVIDAQDEKGKIDWKKVIKNISKTENDNRSAHK
jgi:hypothetical protein